MKPKTVSILIASVVVLGSLFIWQINVSPFQRALAVEWVENTFPQDVDTDNSNWNVLPFGYTLAPWPKHFQGEPIVSKLTYHKGPPKKFLQEIIQIWRPVEVELEIQGPRTLVENLGADGWKKCFSSRFSCRKEKSVFEKHLALKNGVKPIVSWFETLDTMGARGIHTEQLFPSYALHTFSVITDKGVFQTFTLKAIRNPIGDSAIEVFLKTLGGMKVRDELSSARAWIQNRIQSVKLDIVKRTPDPKLRIEKYIEVQNYIVSHLSVDPAQFAPFFHLAGVTHLLGVELFRSSRSYFGNQEAWTLNIKPGLEALVKYAQDFQAESNQNQVRNLEALLQDILLLQQKLSKGQNLKRQ